MIKKVIMPKLMKKIDILGPFRLLLKDSKLLCIFWELNEPKMIPKIKPIIKIILRNK